jgi:transmembrane sensor
MDEIIIRSLQGRATAAEEQTLRAWRQVSLQNERHYRDLARTWRLTGLLEPAVASTPPALALGKPKIFSDRTSRRRLFTYAATLALTAAAALVIGLGIGVFGRTDATHPLAAEEFVTARNELVTTRLSDGTVIRLGPNSRLRVGQSERDREVWLDGRAFFAVSKDGRRFVVKTHAGDAVVLGTRFDVNVQENGMQVFVVEGRVAHHVSGQSVEVGAMEISRVTNGGSPRVETIQDARPLLSWLGEFLVFQSTPMRDVARELERRFAVHVRVADAAVAERTVTAWFGHESLQEVLLIVCRAAGAHCSVRGDTVSIEP